MELENIDKFTPRAFGRSISKVIRIRNSSNNTLDNVIELLENNNQVVGNISNNNVPIPFGDSLLFKNIQSWNSISNTSKAKLSGIIISTNYIQSNIYIYYFQ